MHILVLGPTSSPVSSVFQQNGYSLTEHSGPVDKIFLNKNSIDFAVSYKYRHVINRDIIDFLNGEIINLHISYLPWNRGADPNLWSFLEDSPKGVSIHYVDPGIDTGDLITQKQIFFDEYMHTLASTYEILNKEIIDLFVEYLDAIVTGNAPGIKQPEGGTVHKLKDKEPYLHLLDKKGWDTPVLEVKGKALPRNKCNRWQ